MHGLGWGRFWEALGLAANVVVDDAKVTVDVDADVDDGPALDDPETSTLSRSDTDHADHTETQAVKGALDRHRKARGRRLGAGAVKL